MVEDAQCIMSDAAPCFCWIRSAPSSSAIEPRSYCRACGRRSSDLTEASFGVRPPQPRCRPCCAFRFCGCCRHSGFHESFAGIPQTVAAEYTKCAYSCEVWFIILWRASSPEVSDAGAAAAMDVIGPALNRKGSPRDLELAREAFPFVRVTALAASSRIRGDSIANLATDEVLQRISVVLPCAGEDRNSVPSEYRSPELVCAV